MILILLAIMTMGYGRNGENTMDTPRTKEHEAPAARQRTLKVGIGQMRVIGGAPEVNLDTAVDFIRKASEQQCDLVVLPEALDFGWTNTKAKTEAHPIPGPYSAILTDAARQHRIHVVAGLTEKDGDRVYNAAVLIAPDGEILHKHRKINILDIARDLYTPGRTLAVTETALGRIGLDICADNWPSVRPIGHTLALMGADLIVSPSAWAVPPDHDNEKDPYGGPWIDAFTDIAQTHGVPVIGVSNVGTIADGPWAQWLVIGASLVVSHDGQVQQQCDYTSTDQHLYVIDVALKK